MSNYNDENGRWITKNGRRIYINGSTQNSGGNRYEPNRLFGIFVTAVFVIVGASVGIDCIGGLIDKISGNNQKNPDNNGIVAEGRVDEDDFEDWKTKIEDRVKDRIKDDLEDKIKDDFSSLISDDEDIKTIFVKWDSFDDIKSCKKKVYKKAEKYKKTVIVTSVIEMESRDIEEFEKEYERVESVVTDTINDYDLKNHNRVMITGSNINDIKSYLIVYVAFHKN